MKKIIMAVMAVAAIVFTSCEHSSMTDIMTDVVTSGKNEGAYAAEKFADVYIQAIAAEQGGSVAGNHIFMKAQSDDSKAKAAAVKGADAAKATVLAKKTYEIQDWVSKETYTVQVTEGSESDWNAIITVEVADKAVVNHYFKVAK